MSRHKFSFESLFPYLFSFGFVVPLTILLATTLTGCDDSSVGPNPGGSRSPSAKLEVTGTMGQQVVNGKEIWVIIGDDEQRYLPVDLARPWIWQKGLRVRVEAERVEAGDREGRGEDVIDDEGVGEFNGELIRIRGLDILNKEAEPPERL